MPEATNKRTIVVFILAILSISVLFFLTLPRAIDWQSAFRPAALKLMRGQSPFTIEGYFNPPWALIPLIPFAILPEAVGRALLATTTLLVYIYVAHELGGGNL